MIITRCMLEGVKHFFTICVVNEGGGMEINMKVLWQIIPSLCGGGAEKMVIDLTKAIDKRKFKVILISLFDENFAEEYRLSDAKQNNINVVFLNKKLGFDASIFVKINNMIKRERPDIIHTHLECIKYVWPLSKIHNIKHVHTLHYATIGSEALFCRKMIWHACQNSNFNLVVLSDAIRKDANTYYKISPDRIHTVLNGIDITRFRVDLRKYNTHEDDLLFICVASLTPVKNHQLLINAFYDFQRKHNRTDQLLLVGDGPLRGELEGLVAKLNMKNQVSFIGKVGNVEHFLRKSDVFVLSSHTEGVPLAVIEAMSSGLPIIAPEVGGLKDMISGNGFLFCCDDKDALIMAFEDITFNDEIRRIFSNQSSILAESYSLDNMARGYEQIYLG